MEARHLTNFTAYLIGAPASDVLHAHVRDHFASDAELWCVDVDGVNVEEAKNFVKNSICKPIPFYPPTDLPTDYFEFVYGISVFTHLSECAQEVWLQELKRVSRSGALLIMSVKNEFAAINSSANNGSLLRDLLLLGISDRWLDGNLGQQLDRKSSYRGTMHLTQYVREQWSRHFEIVDIVVGQMYMCKISLLCEGDDVSRIAGGNFGIQ